MSRLFNRAARLTCYRANAGSPGGFIDSNPTFFQQLPNATVITELRIQAHIEKSIDKSPNTLKVTITNLAEATRVDLTQRPLTVRVDAGYDGIFRHIFTGDMRTGWSEKKGTDWLTHLYLADGDRAYRFARVNKSYKRGTPIITAVRECARTMGIQDLDLTVASSSDLKLALENGEVLDGASRDELTRLLAPYGYSWSIQSGRLQILRDEQTSATEAWVISEQDGMIESPEFSVPDQPKKSAHGSSHKASTPKVPKLKVRNLLFPELTPGGRIDVRALATSGIYKMMRVVHDLDTGYGGKWETQVEAVAV